MRSSIKQSLKLGFVVLVVAAVATTGLAIAQTTDDAQTDDPAVTEQAPDRARGFRGIGHGMRGGDVLRGGLVSQDVADLLDSSRLEILEQLNDGASLADVAAASGSSGQAVIDLMVGSVSERLDDLVADERITADEAAERLADAEARITEFVNTEDPVAAHVEERAAQMLERQAEREAQQQALLDLLGLTEDELRAAIEDGQTLAEVAEAQGVTVDEIVAIHIAPLADRLAEAVANGDMTQDEADQKLADAEARIAEGIENGRGLGRGPGRGHGGPGRGGPRRGGPGEGFGPGGGFGGGFGSGFGPGGAGTETGVSIDA